MAIIYSGIDKIKCDPGIKLGDVIAQLRADNKLPSDKKVKVLMIYSDRLLTADHVIARSDLIQIKVQQIIPATADPRYLL